MTFNYAYPETQRWAFTSESTYENSVANAVQQLYGGLSSQFSGEEALNLMSVNPSPAAAVPVIKEKAETTSSNGSATGMQTKPQVALFRSLSRTPIQASTLSTT